MTKEKQKSTKEKKSDYKDSQVNYFEAILQLRYFNEDQFNKIIDYIEFSENNCKISKHVPHKNGVDIYLSSQKFIQHLSRWLKNNFNCQINLTSTLHTRNSLENKDLYRLTVCVRFTKHKVGDIIEYNGDDVKITSLGKKPSGKITHTGKRIFLDMDLIN
jgi:NMD protein affecting ribosome stability and mRNA decay